MKSSNNKIQKTKWYFEEKLRNSNRVTLKKTKHVDVEKKLNDQSTFYTKLINGLRWLAWLI